MERLSHRTDIVLATTPPVSHRTAEENLGIGYLTACLRDIGLDTKIEDAWLEGIDTDQLAHNIIRSNPRLFVGFSCYRSNMERTIDVAQMIKKAGVKVPIIVGGFGPTFHSDEFLNAGFDVVVKGEGEERVIKIANSIATGSPQLGEISGISYKINNEVINNPSGHSVQNLDSLSFPARDTLSMSLSRKSPLHLLTARGCEANCIFCSVVAFERLSYGPQWRQRSVGNIVDEIEDLNRSGVKHIKIVDDSFIEPPRDEFWCEKLADEINLRNLNISFRGSIRADRVTDNILRHLKRAGFIAFSCGIENGSETALKRMGKTASLSQNEKALDLFKKHDIYVQAGQILFDHGTTMQELEENYEFMSKYVWTISKGIFSEMYPANGTPYTRLLSRKGLLELDSRNLGNHSYGVQDTDAEKVYCALKIWHKSHMGIYDMAIDVLSAPKSLSKDELDLFHPFCVELKQRDLDFMRIILDMVRSGVKKEDMISFASSEAGKSMPWYLTIKEKVGAIYASCNLRYDADENPFIC